MFFGNSWVQYILYNTNFSRGGNVRFIREFGFCAKFSSRENNIHCEWNFAKLSSREIFFPRNFTPRENKILSGLSLYNIQQKRLHIAVLVGVPLAHGQVITVLFNLFVTFVHLLHAFCTMYIFNVAGHWAQ